MQDHLPNRLQCHVELYAAPREVDIPSDLKKFLQNQVWELLDKLSYTNKKEFVQWIKEAKKAGTRGARKQKMLEDAEEETASSRNRGQGSSQP